jgi:hypothetical protein
MTGWGQIRPFRDVRSMSGLAPKGDVDLRSCDVAKVPKADSCGAANGIRCGRIMQKHYRMERALKGTNSVRRKGAPDP